MHIMTIFSANRRANSYEARFRTLLMDYVIKVQRLPRSPLDLTHFISSMAKGKGKEVTLNHNNVPNKDIIQRMNFLYQAAVHIAEVASLPSVPKPPRVLIGSSHGLTQDSSPYTQAAASNNPEAGANEIRDFIEDGNDTTGLPELQAQTGSASKKKRPKLEVDPAKLIQVYGKSMRDIGLKTNVRM